MSPAARMPAGAAQVRIEKYTFTGAPAQYVVYVAGTRSSQLGGTQPFDNRSNLQLYSRQRSASYDATIAAMGDAQASRITANALAARRPARPHAALGHVEDDTRARDDATCA